MKTIAMNLFCLLFASCHVANNLPKKKMHWETPPHVEHAEKAQSVYELRRLPCTYCFWKSRRLEDTDESGRELISAVNDWNFLKSREVAWGPTWCYLVEFKNPSFGPYLLECKNFTMPYTVAVATVHQHWPGFFTIGEWFSKKGENLKVPVSRKKMPYHDRR